MQNSNSQLPLPSDEFSGRELINFLDNNNYPKPRWMLNKDITDNDWFIAKVGMDVPSSEPFKKHNYETLSFKKEVAPGEMLTNKSNAFLLADIKNSLLYLNTIGKISRPKRCFDIFNTTIHLIRHANELRAAQNKPIIRNLNMIKFNDLKSYLKSFQVTHEHFARALELTTEQFQDFENIDWLNVKSDLTLTTRELKSLKRKLKNYFSENTPSANKASHYISEYPNASRTTFNIDVNLAPSEKSITNEISALESIFASRAAQKYKFMHSARNLFSNGLTIFDEVAPSEKTKLMPVSVALHAMSKALHFVRNYGPGLRSLVKSLSVSEQLTIKELNISPSQVMGNIRAIREHAFNNTIMPNSLKELKITTWEYDIAFEKVKHDWLRNNLSVEAAILLYIASMWILLASFTSGRKLSLTTLKRNCFLQSPIDGLFDIVFRMPKSSERFELEDAHRPIPDLIFDYGLEFALFVSELEERQGFNFNEEDVYLFGKILSLHSSSAFNHAKQESDKTDFYKYPLSGDTTYKALCLFQDWSESHLIDGKRWYPSNHQFRRLFAVLYFNFSNSKGLEELSWFMGHSSLERTFHYAEVSPTDDWIEEAESTIAKIGSSLDKVLNADKTLTEIIDKAQQSSDMVLVLEPLIRKMIDDHKRETGQQVRFKKIDDEDIFFYFCAHGETP